MVNLKHDGFKCTEILVKAHGLGFRLKEIPVDYNHQTDSKAVPGGIKMIQVTAIAMLALFQLWVQSFREYKDGILQLCPIRGKQFIDCIIRKV